MVKIDKRELQQQLMKELKELSNIEQDEIRIYSALFLNACENIEKTKVNLLEESISNQIKFYGRNKEIYDKEIEKIINKYQELIEKISNLYVTRFCAILEDLQDTYSNQKIAITNCKISIDSMNEVKKEALLYKINNYETVIQECKKAFNTCKSDVEKEINEIFYNKTNALSVKKANIFQQILNIFVGKKKIQKFVIDSINFELKQLEENINNKIKKIQEETINNIAIIEGEILQTKTIYKNMLEEYGYNE